MIPFPSPLLTVAAAAGTVGPGGPYTTTGQVGSYLGGASSYSASANEMSLRPIRTPVFDCSVSSLDISLNVVGTNGTKIRPLIYTDSGGVPGTLVIQGSESTINTTDNGTAKTLPFGSTVTLTAETKYWIGWIADHAFTAICDAISGYTRFVSQTYTSGAPSTAPTMSTSIRRISVRLNVSMSGGVLGNWGYDGNDGSAYNVAANEVGVIPITMPSAGTSLGNSVLIRLHTSVTAGDKFKGVIYADSGGAPGSLIATGSEVTVASADVELESVISSPATLSPSTKYWIGYLASGGTDLKNIPSGIPAKFKSTTYSSGPPDPFGTPTTSSNCPGLYLKFS